MLLIKSKVQQIITKTCKLFSQIAINCFVLNEEECKVEAFSLVVRSQMCGPHCKLSMCVCSTFRQWCIETGSLKVCARVYISCDMTQSWCMLLSKLHYTHTNDSCKDAFHCCAGRQSRGEAMSLCCTLIEWEGESVWLQFPYHLNEPWPLLRESGENRQISPEAQWWSSAREKWPED